MGVTGLWTVVQPCARPIKIETLNKKRLAVDASIWIYQFLKAVRDKEGNQLRNSHVVGFFRRICKLLFFGIKPVFVFDGGAPALKRQTISGRKARREGRREDAVRTAGKLLAVQMQRRAEEEERKRREERSRPAHGDAEEPLPENLVYVDELHMTERERQANRKFKRKDAYHLPDLDVSLAAMGAPDDPRIMSLEELEQYARQFDTGEDINVYDFSKIDFDSPFFVSLPASDRYNILNAARLRSRLRMGYSKDQLDSMFPDRMAFSKFQIERVTERNELTQRLMHINGMVDDTTFGSGLGRVAGEKGREYVLVKNDGVEGGWALGVVSSKEEGGQSKPIDVDQLDKAEEDDEGEDWADEDEFEDVPVEGLNRLPKRMYQAPDERVTSRDTVQRRQKIYKSRKQSNRRQSPRREAVAEDDDSLFVANNDEGDEEWEDVGIMSNNKTNGDGNDEDDEEVRDLQRAIAMSLEGRDPISEPEPDADDYEEVFNQKKAPEATPFTGGSGMAIARVANNRSNKATVSRPFAESDSDNDDLGLHGALAESRNSKHQSRRIERSSSPRPRPRPKSPAQRRESPSRNIAKAAGFDGPLPFEKLDLGSSLLGRKKMKKLEEDAAGGFEKDISQKDKEKEAVPLPPWFSSNMQEDMNAQKIVEQKDRDEQRRAEQLSEEDGFIFQPRSKLTGDVSVEIIDLEGEPPKTQEVIDLDSDVDEEAEANGATQPEVVVDDPEIRMGDLADKVRAEPPVAAEADVDGTSGDAQDATQGRAIAKDRYDAAIVEETDPATHPSDDEILDWSESDEERNKPKRLPQVKPAGGEIQARQSPSPSPEFEDVLMTTDATATSAPDVEQEPLEPFEETTAGPIPASGLADQDIPIELDDEDLEEPYSDPEDEELFRQLAEEEEEHARFASTLNNRSEDEPVDYEKELRQLRNQQKKDRRDADEVTQVMIQECQQLLALFGLPYITAPMEAEAQCAELVDLGLVDGIVTDDSDCFLFGGTRIYKNMFNQAKFVECYLEQDLVSEFGLSRNRLIGIAQLLGSDYTEGLPGVGPVTALEIMSEFDNLTAFKEWWSEVQTGGRSKAEDAGNAFRKKFRKNATKLFLPPAFPDPRVEQAYLKPEVDADPHPFVWGVPDLDALRSFLMSTIGWNQARTDEILVPVIKDMNRRLDEGTQSNITNFFSGGVGAGAFAPRRREEGKSKRLETALGKMKQKARGDTIGEGEDDTSAQVNGDKVAEEAQTVPAGSKAKGKKRAKKSNATNIVTTSEDEEEYVEPKRVKKASRRNKQTSR